MNRYIKKSLSFMKNKTRIKQVTQEALGMLRSKKKLKSVKGQVLLLVDLVHDAVLGSYKGWSKKNVVLALAALIYLISPIDLIPDFIVGLGFGDDITIIAWAFTKLSLELKRYVDWRRSKGDVIDMPESEEDPQAYKVNEEEWTDIPLEDDEVHYRVSEEDL